MRDPRNLLVVMYVGATTRTLTYRLGVHRSGKQRTRRWCDELKRDGITPIIELLEIVESEESMARENHWITYFRPPLNVNRPPPTDTSALLADIQALLARGFSIPTYSRQDLPTTRSGS